jgi:hypothetical protein
MNGILLSMFDVRTDRNESEDPPRPLLRRLLDNPVRLRRQSLVALAIAIILSGVTRLTGGWIAGLLLAFTWIIVLPIALGIAAGDAFMVAHGRNRRRLLLTMIGAVIVAVLSCGLLALLSEATGNRRRDIADCIAYCVFYGANVLGLSALMALAIGRGGDYVSRRIDAMSNDDW